MLVRRSGACAGRRCGCVGRLAAALQYIFVPVGDLTLQHDGGNDYYTEFKEPNLGGLTLRIGLVAEF